MNTNKLNILYVIERTRTNKSGKCPIRCRLTFIKKRKVFSTGLFISPDEWDSKKQIAKPSEKQSKYINSQLSLTSQNLNQAFLLLQVNEGNFDVNDIYLQFKGENTTKNKTLMETFETHNSRMKKLVGTEYSLRTFYKFRESKNHLEKFLKHSYKRNDMPLANLTLKFLDDYDFYLKTEVNQKQITINKSIQRLRKVVKIGLGEGFIDRDPFLLYKPKKYKVDLVYLSADELKQLEQHDFSYNTRLEKVKDCFVFCCYTGLAYAEMANLRKEHFVKGFDSKIWIKMTRQKTGGLINVPLLETPLAILEKYGDDIEILPVISNQKFNSYLKEIGVILGFEKRLTHHIARKTFATTVLLYNDVPMEIVSELLGHSKMQITQKHYGKVVQKKIGEAIGKLSKKLNSKN